MKDVTFADFIIAVNDPLPHDKFIILIMGAINTLKHSAMLSQSPVKKNIRRFPDKLGGVCLGE